MYDEAVRRVRAGETDQFMTEFNPDNSGWGSHITALAAAALSTTGDILECGTGFFSTPLLHTIALDQARFLLSSDTELSWLVQFRNMSGDHHQLIGVPVYEDGASCGRYHTERLQPLDFEKISFVGNVDKQLISNQVIKCPNIK